MKTKDIIMTALFTALIAAGAFIRIPVPVCPFTLQFLFTTLAGVLLGSRKGAAAVGVYVILGLAGLPIFTSGGGIGYTAAYLWIMMSKNLRLKRRFVKMHENGSITATPSFSATIMATITGYSAKHPSAQRSLLQTRLLC